MPRIETDPARVATSRPRTAVRLALGGMFVLAGVAHLTFARGGFRVAVPESLPVDRDLVVVTSGAAEIGLGAFLIGAGGQRVAAGWTAAAFLAAIFPGNVSQALHRRDAPGLDTDAKRLARLLGQPLLIAAALWSTGAWRDRAALGRLTRR
jgi:uncharacterized membrane protein